MLLKYVSMHHDLSTVLVIYSLSTGDGSILQKPTCISRLNESMCEVRGVHTSHMSLTGEEEPSLIGRFILQISTISFSYLTFQTYLPCRKI